MALELVIGYQGKDHVTAEQWADFNRGIFGDAAILPVGNRMETAIQTANQITVKDGVAVFDGREVYIGYGETENIAITSGTQGMLRRDIVVVEYTREEETGVESVQFKVINGTPAASNAKDPSVQDMDIRTGVFGSQKPFCRVRLNGTAIEGVDSLVSVKEFKDHAFADPVNSLAGTDPRFSLAAPQGRALDQKITAINSALDDIEQSNQPFVEQWIDGMTRYEVIISFDDIDISKTNRIPVLIGGNINNAPFLYMYNFDLPNLPQNATAVEGTPILQISQTFYVTGNKDGNNSRRLRILFNNQTNSGAHVYIDVKVCGGEVIGTNTYPLS